MTERPSPHAWRLALLYLAAALLLAGLAAWHYLMGHYARILAPALLALPLLLAALLRLAVPSRPRLPAWLALAAGQLLLAFELPWLGDATTFWIGLAPLLPLLLLPLLQALLLNLVAAPLWLLRAGDALDVELTLGLVALLVLAPLALWEQRRQRALRQAIDPRDPHCQALSRAGLQQHLASEFQRTTLLQQPLALLVIHLPQLEMAGEQFGSRARQALLDTLCREVTRCSRRHDTLGRYTSATFWLVLPNTSDSGGQLVQQRILQALDAVVLLDTGPLRTRTALCQRLPDEPWPRLRERLRSVSQRLENQ